jgi:hypothetical protein
MKPLPFEETDADLRGRPPPDRQNVLPMQSEISAKRK